MRAFANRLLPIVSVLAGATASLAQTSPPEEERRQIRYRSVKTRTPGRAFDFWIGAALIVATLTACTPRNEDSMFDPARIVFGGTKQIKDAQPIEGFMPEPSLLQAGAPGQAVLVYRNQTANFAIYNKVFLDQVTIWTAPDSALARVPEDQRQVLANRFYTDVYNALGRRCQMVASPTRPGTLHLRIALTDATTAHPVLNTVAHYAPYGISSAYSLASLAFNDGVGFFSGKAVAELYATDATTGNLLWQAVDKRGGTTAFIANTLNSWRDVENAFRAWSTKIADRLQEFGACRNDTVENRKALE